MFEPKEQAFWPNPGHWLHFSLLDSNDSGSLQNPPSVKVSVFWPLRHKLASPICECVDEDEGRPIVSLKDNSQKICPFKK